MPEPTERIADLESREKELLKKIDEMSDRLKSLENRRLLYEMIGAAVVVGIFIAFGWEPRSIAREVAKDVSSAVAKETAEKFAKDEAEKFALRIMKDAQSQASKVVREEVPGMVSRTVGDELRITTIAEIGRMQKEARKTLDDATAARDEVKKRLDDLKSNQRIDVDEIVARKITAREELISEKTSKASEFKTTHEAVTIRDDENKAVLQISSFEKFGIFLTINKADESASIVMSRPDKLDSSNEPPGLRFSISNTNGVSHPVFRTKSAVPGGGGKLNQYRLDVMNGEFWCDLGGAQQNVEFK